MKRTDNEIIMGFQVFSTPEYEKLDSGMLSICMRVFVYMHFASS
jgi:hypothetical protein